MEGTSFRSFLEYFVTHCNGINRLQKHNPFTGLWAYYSKYFEKVKHFPQIDRFWQLFAIFYLKSYVNHTTKYMAASVLSDTTSCGFGYIC